MKRIRPRALVGVIFLLGLTNSNVNAFRDPASRSLGPLPVRAPALFVATALFSGERQLRGSDELFV